MSGYKVSYQVLSRQGDALKALAREVDGYAARVDAVCGRLGDDELLAEVRQNLRKLSRQLRESRAVLNLSGEIVERCTAGYNQTEKVIVQKVDTTRAHNRDFYKNPVVVVSSGNTVNIIHNYGAAPSPTPAPVPDTVPEVTPAVSSDSSGTVISDLADSLREKMSGERLNSLPEEPPSATQSSPAPVHTAVQTEMPAMPVRKTGLQPGAVAAVTAAGGAAGAGILFGAQKLRQFLKNREQQKSDEPVPEVSALDDAELEEMLEKARQEAQKYQKTDSKTENP